MSEVVASQIPDIVEYSIPNFEKYNPRKDVAKSSWVRLESSWESDKSLFGLSGAQLVVWPVLLGNYVGTVKFTADIPVAYLVGRLKSKNAFIRNTLAELHNRKRIQIENLSTLRDVALRTNVTNETNETNERNEVEKTKGQKTSPKSPSPSRLFEIWNSKRGSLPEAKKLSTGRIAKAKARLKEEPNLTYWQSTIELMAATPFLCGENDRGWKADFDWLILNDGNHLKVSEGRYTNETKKAELSDEEQWERRKQALKEEGAWADNL